jgi:hypothetical protein
MRANVENYQLPPEALMDTFVRQPSGRTLGLDSENLQKAENQFFKLFQRP